MRGAMDENRVAKDVWKTVQEMNRAWTVERRPERLVEFFHRDMVAVTATDRHRLVGQMACVAGWKGFVDRADVKRWTEIDPKVQVYAGGLAAVVTYDFEIAFEMEGRLIELGGRDTYALVLEDGRWWVVLDHFSPFPA